MGPGDATEGDNDSIGAGVDSTVAKPPPLDNYELVTQQVSEITKEFKGLTNSDDRRRDAIMVASRRRHQKALSLEQNDHWKVQYEITATLSSAVKLTDLNRQSVDNRIAMEIVQIGPSIESNVQHAQRKAKHVQSLQDKVERESLRELLKQGDSRTFQEHQGKRRLVERSVEKQIQMSQTKASLALDLSRRLQAKVKAASLELSANYRFFNDLTQQLLDRQRQIRAAFEPIRGIAEDKLQSCRILQQLEIEAANDRRNLERQHLDLFGIKSISEKPELPERLQIERPAVDGTSLDATSLFFGGLKDAARKNPPSAVEPPPATEPLSLDQESEQVEIRMVQASWGLAIIKAKLQSAQSRIDKVRVATDRILQATAVDDLETIAESFVNADEFALLLYQKLGGLRDGIVALESGLRTDFRHEMTAMDQRREQLQQHLTSGILEDDALKTQLKDGHRDIALICEKVSGFIDDFQLPKPMVPISDLNLFEAIGIIETYVHSLLSGGKPPTLRETSTVIEEPSAERFFSSWTTPQHRRVRTYLDAQELSRALAEETKVVD